MYDKVKEMLIRHEGVMCTLYKCSESRWTIGAGRNLEDRGITEEEAMYLLDNDIKRVMNQLKYRQPLPKKIKELKIVVANI